MTTYDQIIKKQIEWAKNRGVDLIGSEINRGRKSYTSRLKENLFQELSESSKNEINNGDGGELLTKNGKPARMQALHSSSALGVNFFEYWRSQKDLSHLTDACKLTRSNDTITGKIHFEDQYPIEDSLKKNPNIDAVIRPDSYSYKAFAIECKFTEPYSSYEHSGVKNAYFDFLDIWSNLINTKKLARTISPNDDEFEYLHAGQLIKHILGLNKQFGHTNYRLLYLWYDAYGGDGYKHQREINRFKKVVEQDGVKFSSMTYQELILRLASHRNKHSEYISYLTERYL